MNSDINNYLARYLITALKMSPESLQNVDITGLTLGFEIEVAINPEYLSSSNHINELTKEFLKTYQEPTEEEFFEELGLVSYIHQYTDGPQYGWAVTDEDDSNWGSTVWDSMDPNQYPYGPEVPVPDTRKAISLSDIGSLEQARTLFKEKETDFNLDFDDWSRLKYNIELQVYISKHNKPVTSTSYFLDRLKSYFPKVNAGLGTDYSRWSVVEDSSIKHDMEDEDSNKNNGAELVSPVFKNVDAGIEALKKMFKFISKHKEFSTNTTTGLHINIGTFKDGKLNGKPVDLLKLLLFLGESYVLKQFERTSNTYTQPVLDDLVSVLSVYDDPLDSAHKYAGIVAKTNKLILSRATKYRTCNVTHFNSPDNGRLEFRGMGNKNYHKRIDDVIATINRYVKAINLAVDPNNGRHAYLKKLALLRNKVASNPSTSTAYKSYLVENKVINEDEWASLVNDLLALPNQHITHMFSNYKLLLFFRNPRFIGESEKLANVVALLVIIFGSQRNKISPLTLRALFKLCRHFKVTKATILKQYEIQQSYLNSDSKSPLVLDFDTFIVNAPSTFRILFK